MKVIFKSLNNNCYIRVFGVFLIILNINSCNSINTYRNTNSKSSIETKSNEKDIILNLIVRDCVSVLQAKNVSHGDMEILLKPTNKSKSVLFKIVSAKDSVIIKTWPSADREKILKDFNLDYTLKAYFGNSKTIRPDTNYLYKFPFKKGKKYAVAQSFNGVFSHASEASKYAIDFTMKIGEPVHAAREGLVIKTVSHFKEHGGKEFKNRANRILIQHPDGTIASYVHLDYQGVFVSEGDRVKRGQKIGLSGFTGYTRGPHLHFVVRKERDIAIPIYFEGYENKILQKGKRYRTQN